MKCKIVSGFLSGSSGVISGNGTHHGRKVFIVDIERGNYPWFFYSEPYLFYPEELDITASVTIGDSPTRKREDGKLVVIESPFAGDTERNIEYARQAMRRVIESGNTPFASHLLYTQVLDDNLPKEREIGIKAGLSIYKKADECAVFAKYGCSNGMRSGILAAIEHGVPIVVYDDDRISGMVTNIRTILEWMK